MCKYRKVLGVSRSRLSGRARDILELVVNNSGITVSEISRRLGLHRSTLDRYVKILKDLGLVETKPGRGGGVYPTKDAVLLVRSGGRVTIVRRGGGRARILIEAEDRPGLLADVTNRLASAGVNILETELKVEEGIAIMEFEAENVVHEEVLQELDGLSGLIRVEVEPRGRK
ncbi:Predicted transcriptional regulator of amino acid metabolism consisting of an ACT domain and a DNA-binding HTH domain [Methanopyrus kandleri AV19]|uniref:Predicted transcriptional regulator of amino acid metabolism consisting of an ACT domain and a DNA-binding HTH domain n=1 Tax=Methanopyrus kandleri (strain AV19 / DSM 6324 / JCM 9639 / NBRC 100938) TaxID=190192 RepID=Q8TWK8_METKA|nr:Predicted transcriptional regulator of amino acid metabolism consisting of an ACT domain and a DNA-binding HTH domain [Methanopyrus kandleri AV19]